MLHHRHRLPQFPRKPLPPSTTLPFNRAWSSASAPRTQDSCIVRGTALHGHAADVALHLHAQVRKSTCAPVCSQFINCRLPTSHVRRSGHGMGAFCFSQPQVTSRTRRRSISEHRGCCRRLPHIRLSLQQPTLHQVTALLWPPSYLPT